METPHGGRCRTVASHACFAELGISLATRCKRRILKVMFTNWYKLVALGGLAGWMFTLLAFFGIDAKTLGRTVTAHYLFLIGSVCFFLIFLTGCYAWWRSLRITPDNLQRKLREWLDASGLQHRVMPWGALVFRL